MRRDLRSTAQAVGRLGCALALLVLAAHTGFAQSQTPLTLDAARAEAEQQNPTIVAARLARPVAAAAVEVARERLNPELTYEAERETPHQAVGASFPIELGGKRDARATAAAVGIRTADAEYAGVVADVLNAVRRAYFTLVAADAGVRLATEVRDLAARAQDAAQGRVAAGDAPRLDAIQAELALAAAEDELSGARGEASAARVDLNVLLGRPADRPIVLAALPPSGPLPSLDAALALAGQSNTALQLADRRIDEQAAQRDLARAMRIPDLTANSSLTFDAEPEFRAGWRLSFSATVPLLTRHTAAVALQNAELAHLRAAREAEAADVRGAVAAALARATAVADRLDRYQADTLPRVEAVEGMAQEAYAAGQATLASLLQALQSTEDIRRRGLQAALDYQMAVADLERAIGTRLPQ